MPVPLENTLSCTKMGHRARKPAAANPASLLENISFPTKYMGMHARTPNRGPETASASDEALTGSSMNTLNSIATAAMTASNRTGMTMSDPSG